MTVERQFPELDVRNQLPSIGSELRRTVVDLIRGDEPTTVLGLLITQDEPLTVEAIAGLTCKEVGETELTVAMLEEEDLCAHVSQNGLRKVKAFAYHSARNS